MRKIKVLVLISGNDSGGAAKYILNLCGLKDAKIEIILGCIGDGYLYEEAKKLPIEVVLFNTKSLINKDITKYSIDNSIDIINFNGAKLFFSYTILRKKLKAICVATVHSDYRYDFLNNKIKLLFFTPLSKMGLKKFENYICVSTEIKTLLENKNFKGEKYIANNGIDIKENNIGNSSSELRRIYGIADNDFLFVSIARLHPIKNHIKLIEAFNMLKKEYDNVKLICVGDGDMKASIQTKVKEYNLQSDVIMTGFQTNTLGFLAASDISILASLNEAGDPPLVILESATVKKPVICSEIGKLNEIITSEYGYLMDPKNTTDIYLKMKEAYLDKEKLNAKGIKFYEFIEKNYSIDSFYNRYREIFSHMLKNRGF